MLSKVLRRLRKKSRVRAKISGTASVPRLSVYRSNLNIYAQLIDDENGKTLCSASDIKVKDSITKVEKSKIVGLDIAKKANELKITKVVFDRGGFSYQGRVKALADAARENGLIF